jgi:ligand-binding SRPBCC domain-containing protein
MKVHVLRQSQLLPISLPEAWEFFSTPRNLDRITPPDLGFSITYSSAERMEEGQIITYRIRLGPLLQLPWVTEIKVVREPHSFIDVQLAGPYRLWHHQHRFEASEGGTLMTDLVHYALPFGPLGGLAHALWVGRKVRSIFQHRRETLEALFRDIPQA